MPCPVGELAGAASRTPRVKTYWIGDLILGAVALISMIASLGGVPAGKSNVASRSATSWLRSW